MRRLLRRTRYYITDFFVRCLWCDGTGGRYTWEDEDTYRWGICDACGGQRWIGRLHSPRRPEGGVRS